METTYLDHPSEEELERFLLHQSKEPEQEVIETHVLACESCVARLEALEVYISTAKLALKRFEAEEKLKQADKAEHPFRQWLTGKRLSWAGAAALLAVGIAFIPNVVHRSAGSAVEVNLSAYRGLESPFVPSNRTLHMRLNTPDLPDGPFGVEIVTSNGTQLWSGTTAIRKEQAVISVPAIPQSGAYYLRLYAPVKGTAQGDLLKEFAFRTR